MSTDPTPVSLDALPDPDQRAIAERVQRILAERGADHDVRVVDASPEPHAEIRLRRPPDLRLVIRVAPDTFELEANEASLRLARVDWNDDGAAWADGVYRTLAALLDHDLVLRIRRTLLGGRAGAVRIRDGEGPDQWNGDFFACIGMGRERTFPGRWYAG